MGSRVWPRGRGLPLCLARGQVAQGKRVANERERSGWQDSSSGGRSILIKHNPGEREGLTGNGGKRQPGRRRGGVIRDRDTHMRRERAGGADGIACFQMEKKLKERQNRKDSFMVREKYRNPLQ